MQRLLSLLLVALATAANGATVEVSAASSLQDALREVARVYEAKTNEHVAFNFAGSNVLARQINAGAPADVFLSADTIQADKVTSIAKKPLLTNILVVVARKRLRSFQELESLDRIAIGDPNAVPAGVYAKKLLQSMKLWDELQPKLIPMESVRAALAAVENGSVDAAVVYRTDALLAKKAQPVLWADPGDVVYPAVLRTERGRRFFDSLFTPEAAAVFRKFGFGTSRERSH